MSKVSHKIDVEIDSKSAQLSSFPYSEIGALLVLQAGYERPIIIGPESGIRTLEPEDKTLTDLKGNTLTHFEGGSYSIGD